MMYKIMSTVKAHLDENNNIVSPTQTLLQDGILQTSKLMPDEIRDNIIDANVIIDKNSLRNNGVCRGDIYIDTKSNLSLLEQRQLINGMRDISFYANEPIMSPVVIRNAPDEMPEPVDIDVNYHLNESDATYVETESAFIGAHVSSIFSENASVKETYRNANSIAKSLNKELNKLGLRTVFADMSVCNESSEGINRRCYVIFQKTSRFKENSFSNDDLVSAINNSFCSDKLGASFVKDIDIMSMSNKSGLVGSVSFENSQMAGQRIKDMLANSNNELESALIISSINDNPLFVNGIGETGINAIRDKYSSIDLLDEESLYKTGLICDSSILFSKNIPAYDSSNGYTTSTTQDLSSRWNYSNAIMISAVGDKSKINTLNHLKNDIADEINDIAGYDENHPFITKISSGTNLTSGDISSQIFFMMYNPSSIESGNIKDAKKTAINNLMTVLDEYPEMHGLEVNTNLPQPLMSYMKLAKTTDTKDYISKLSKRHTNESLKSDMLNSDFEYRENQLSL